jgi:hypothetical protein
MKMLGGDWSKADLLALIGVLVAVIGIWIAHRDTAKPEVGNTMAGSSPSSGQPAAVTAPKKRVPRSADVSSGQLNFGCEETKQAKTPEVSFGANPADINPRAEWVQTDNVKGQNQQVTYDKDSQNQVRGVLAEGSITGLDKQLFNCPGGGHGTLALHVSWTEDQSSTSGQP